MLVEDVLLDTTQLASISQQLFSNEERNHILMLGAFEGNDESKRALLKKVRDYLVPMLKPLQNSRSENFGLLCHFSWYIMKRCSKS